MQGLDLIDRLFWTINKPYYWRNPYRLVRRLAYRAPAGSGEVLAALPWHLYICVDPWDGIGRSIILTGVYDLALTETAWRLLDPGDRAVDVGANIGYMTGLMAHRVGASGHVTSLEPHPMIWRRLTSNVQRWVSGDQLGTISVRQAAASRDRGRGRLVVPDGFARNQGRASLATGDTLEPYEQDMSVDTIRLDELEQGPLALVKIDVEGHEAAVLEGSRGLLERHEIRDVLFEEHHATHAESIAILRSHGYTVFRIGRGMTRPLLLDPLAARGYSPTDPANFLATVAPDRALARVSVRGWSVLSASHPAHTDT